MKDRTKIGMRVELGNAWAMKTPHPENYMNYLAALRQTAHQREDVGSFNRIVTGDNHAVHNHKSDEGGSTSKKQRKKDPVLGNSNHKPFTGRDRTP